MAKNLNRTRHKAANARIKYEKSLNRRSLLGVFLAEVVSTRDESRSGRMEVFVPALDGSRSNTASYIPCRWASPFAGTTDVEGLGEDVKDYIGTQKSYGMWMVPPDVGNLVLITFADANPSQAFVVSCVFPDKIHHMVPGMSSGKSYSDPSLSMPVAEKNRRDARQSHNDALRPVHVDLAESITKQGLLQDPLRGAGKGSSRRESPSEVFGILTPGPRDPDNFNHRLGGHQFVMDDNLKESLIRLRTRRGVQILLDDTTGSIYMINKQGSAWFELAANGDINLFSEGSINMRAEKNMNIRADGNLNLEAGQNVLMKAAGDRSAKGEYVGIPMLGALGIPPLGVGGNIRFEATGALTGLGATGVAMTSKDGDMDLSAAGRIAYTGAKHDMTAIGTALPWGSGIAFLSDVGAIDFKSAIAVNAVSTGPVSLMGSFINLNTGPGIPAVPPQPSVPAPQIGTNKFKDAGEKAPEFEKPEPGITSDSDGDGTSDLEGAVEVNVENTMKSAKPLAPTAGKRTGKQDEVETILTALVTKEPYVSHYQADPITSSEQEPSADQEVDEKLPPASSEEGQAKPDDVQTTKGTNKGANYVDQAGNVIAGVTDQAKTATDKIGDGVATATGVANDIMGAVNDPLGAADSLLSGNPQYDEALGILNNFASMDATKLLELAGLGGVIAGIKAALPPIRFPTSNALSEKIIGLQKELDFMMAELEAFGIDQFGFDMDMLGAEFGELKGLVDDAIATATDGMDLVNKLKEVGITMPVEGERIFQDKFGNMLVDFSSGIGPVGSTLGLVGDMNKVYSQIAGDIDTPLHENGKLAITSFAQSVGPEVFASSRLRDYVNDPSKHNLVGREMQKWVLDKPGGTVDPVLQGRRLYESQLYQSPDEMDLDFGDLPDGGVSWTELAEMIKTQREEFYVKKTSEDGPPTA